MKWLYRVNTREGSEEITGEVYGTFEDAVEQIRRAVKHAGWSRNSVAVEITITPEEGA